MKNNVLLDNVFLDNAYAFMCVVCLSTVLLISSASESWARPDSFADLAEKLMPAVVNISTSQTVDRRSAAPGRPPMNDFFEEFFRRGQRGQGGPSAKPKQRKVSSLGSGFIVDAEGIIITNNHVIDGADEIVVTLADGTKLDATLLGRDPKTDLAVLSVSTKRKLPFVPLGDSSVSRVGDWVIAIGNPFGLGGSLSAGVISAIKRDIHAGPYDSFIQTDAAINKGNSGGPLFNLDGEVVGVNSAIISPSGGSVGIGFSIPSNLVKSVVGQLREYGETRRGWLGVRIQAVTDELADSLGLDETAGALVSEVAPDGPANKGGVQVGDVIISFDGRKIPEMRDLPRIVAETKIDKSVKVEVVRRGAKKTLRIVTGLLDEPKEEDDMKRTQDKAPEASKDVEVAGLTLQNVSPDARLKFDLGDDVKGALIVDIDDQSAAYESGLRVGDVLVELGQKQVESAQDVAESVKAAQKAGKNTVLVFVMSGKNGRFVAWPVED
jgi:serine protease Do